MGFNSPNPTLTNYYKHDILIKIGENNMRAKDKTRLIAMNEIEVRGRAILILSEQYKRAYKDNYDSNQDKMDVLDDLWRIITDNNLVLTRILRENGV